jgi:hypothetical protein
MIPRNSISNPYLAIAQHYGVSHGHVLSYSDYIERKEQFDNQTQFWEMQAITKLNQELMLEIRIAVRKEQKRREEILKS